MGDPLCDRRSLSDLAASQQVVEIAVEIECLPRLGAAVTDNLSALGAGKIPAGWGKSAVTGRLEFGFAGAGAGLATLRISLMTMVPEICQRCLQLFEMPLSTTLAVLLCGPDDEPVETQDFEIWDLEEGFVSPIDVVDEALVMAMPFSTMHEDAEDCVAVATVDTDEKMTTPFASLRARMDKGT